MHAWRMSELRFIDTWGSMFEGTSGDSLGPLYVFGYQPILQMKQLRMSEVTVWASLIAQLAKNPPAIQRHRFDSWVRKICWRRDRLPTPVSLGFPYHTRRADKHLEWDFRKNYQNTHKRNK